MCVDLTFFAVSEKVSLSGECHAPYIKLRSLRFQYEYSFIFVTCKWAEKIKNKENKIIVEN